MRLLFLLSLTAGLLAQPDQVAYDWSGQYGFLVDRGAMVWNRDWSLGALALDGTLINYPSRFGPTIASRLAPDQDTLVYQAPDSTGVISRLINDRGDNYLDNLDISLEFNLPKSRVEIVGFKRVYVGPYRQYSGPEQGPLQQSYFLNYTGGTGRDTVLVTLGKFIGNSGLPDNGGLSFLRDEILAGGMVWIRQGKHNRFTTRISPFFQRYRGESSLAGGNFNYQLGQTVIAQSWERHPARWFAGLSWDWIRRGRELAPGLLLTPRQLTLWGHIHRSKNLDLKLGASFLDENPTAVIKLRWRRSGKWAEQQIIGERETRPGIDFDNRASLNQTWTHFGYELSHSRERIALNFGTNMTLVAGLPTPENWNSLLPGLLPGSWEQSAGILLKPISRWSLETQWKHYSGKSDLGPGYGDRFSELIRAQVFLFQQKMDLNIHFRMDGYFHRQRAVQFNPVRAMPEYQLETSRLVRDPLWILTMGVEAHISSVTITWTMNNAALLFAGNNPDYLINWYDEFQPLGRMSRFTIDWSFTN